MTSDPRGQPTRTNPLGLYEILSAVLSFLDRPSLMQAGLVCSSWRTCSQPILQKTCAILNQDLLRFFSPPSKFDMPLRTQMQAAQFVTQMQAAKFVKTCHRVKSLRIGSILKRFDSSGGPFDVHSTPLLPLERMSYLFQVYRAYQVHPRLKNLVHLDVHFNSETAGYAGRGDGLTPQADFYAIMYGLILDNDNLQDLEVTDAGSSSISTLYERLCDLKVAHRVRRLSIKTDAAYFPFETLLSDLSKANAASSPNDAKEQEQGAGAEQWTLQELVLQSVRSHVEDRLSVYAKSASCERYPGIRSLTLLDFALYREVATDAESIADTYTHTENDTLDTPSRYMDPKLYLIQQCPNLERLRISHDLSPISLSSRKSFSECVLSIVPDFEDESRWMQAPENFVQEMSKACPKLKAIDLGGNVDLSDTQWEEMMGVYGRQLESLSVWGVLNFSAEALVRLLEPHPLSAIAETPRTPGMTSRLTELDISWAGGVETCAWLVFSTLPCLKHFKARQVPLDAARLVGYDWVCKDLETLAIQVLVPMQQWPLEPVWVGDRIVERGLSKECHGGHTETFTCEGLQIPETSASPASRQGDDCDDNDGYAEKFASKRIRVQESEKERKKAKKAKKARKERKQSTEGKDRKEARKEKKEQRKSKESKRSKKRTCSQQSDRDSESNPQANAVNEQSSSTNTPPRKALRESEPPMPYHLQVQVELCEQLGRLHRLRELTLEGQRDCRYDDREWDCMHLTLKTGLDRLEGLQNSLERLVLYQLQEELAGDQEVEWIAQHWIHHQNPVWQQRYQRQRQSHNGIIDDEEEDAEDDLWRPEPKFKELLGVGVRNTSSYSSALRAHANLAWLKQECPRLRIEKDHRIQDDDFYVGSFEDY